MFEVCDIVGMFVRDLYTTTLHDDEDDGYEWQKIKNLWQTSWLFAGPAIIIHSRYKHYYCYYFLVPESWIHSSTKASTPSRQREKIMLQNPCRICAGNGGKLPGSLESF